MRRFGKLRTRILSGLRKSSTSTRSRSIHRTSTECDGSENEASTGGLQEQLHWSEARRIYSEPASREFKVDRDSSASEESSASSSSLCGAAARRTDAGRQNGRGLSAAAGKTGPVRRDESLDSQCCAESDGEDDDVFLDSWEETSATVAGSAAGGK